MQKPKYITNKDLLREIHRSKVTFCVFTQPEFADYDVIVSDLELVTPELLALVLDKKQNPRGKIQPTKTFVVEDIVVRLMTHEHIPLDPDRKRKARNTDVSYARTNFPPFKHFVQRDGKLIEVGRSHWKGDIETGEFCLDKGRLGDSLAVMFMMLVERYARRGNWRGYTYVDEMRSHALLQLSQVGLQFDESKGDNPFAFFTTTIHNCFTRVLNVEKKNQNIRDDMLIVAGVAPSYTRQIENEIEQRFPSDFVPPKPKRGAPRRKVAVKDHDALV
ncbi:MAG: hypothetical protein EOO38_18950 [Cytophagaceae bacterium]|nr:MAG: hypothetical protein EOO38_18950 [Cytophagaceae bacterium]